MRRRFTLLALAASAAGCTVGPRYAPPETASPARFEATAADTPSKPTDAPVEETWWRSFGDPELSSLVDRLARQNLDLQSGAERIAEARAVRRIARSQGLPRVQGAADYKRQRESENGLPSLVQPAPGAPLEFNRYDGDLQMSWELDLFGRVRRGVEAADAQTQAAVEDRRALAVSALAELAQTYMRLRGVQAREEVIQRNVDSAELRRKLVQNRFDNGVATLSDLAQARAQAGAVGEDLPTLVAEEARLVNALGLLLAEPPRALRAELFPHVVQAPEPPSVPTGTPAALLRRRPDIRKAEARLHAATAQTGVAVADFFPDVTIAGDFGTESLSAAHIFDWASRMFMIGPTVSVPIFQGGRLKGVLELRRAEEREAAIAYRAAVLRAWRDVDDALTAYGEVQHRLRDARGVVRDDAVALRVAEERYAQGVENFVDVTVAQAELFRGEDAAVQAETDLRTDLVAVYRALGGGWTATEPAAAEAGPPGAPVRSARPGRRPTG